MPYKDPEKQKAYCRDYQAKDRATMKTLKETGIDQTEWNCEKCGKSGHFSNTNLDAWAGFQKVKEEHAKVSPKCDWDAFKVKVTLLDSSVQQNAKEEQ